MPRRKISRKKLAEVHCKQLKLITGRLIEISMKVDGYIYKQKPISTPDAQMYLEEVCSYKKHCQENTRALQVIHKLIYQMKSIIAEQEEGKYTENIYEMIQNSCTRDYETSPVYSIADDEEETSDTISRVLEKTSNELETINLCENDIQNILSSIDNSNMYEIIQNSCTKEYERSPVYSVADSNITDDEEISDSDVRLLEKTSKELGTNNLCDPDDEDIVICHNINKNETQDAVIKDMQKSLSIMSLTPVLKTLSKEDHIHINPDTEIENYSQSILGTNVSLALSQGTQDATAININNPETTTFPRTLYIPNKRQDYAPAPISNKGIETLNEINTCVVMGPKSEALWSVSESNFMNTPNEKNSLKENVLLKNKPRRKREAKAPNAKKIKAKRSDNPGKRNRKKPVTESVKVPIEYKEHTIICPLPDKSIKQDKYFDVMEINAQENISGPMFNLTVSKIYNNEVIDDLSWVENIRYVREVALEEFDPKLTYIDESFWHNYTLPDNWDNRDFTL